MIVGEEIPGVAPLAVVLAHGSPLPLTEVRPPFLPCNFPFAGFLKSILFDSRGHILPPFLEVSAPVELSRLRRPTSDASIMNYILLSRVCKNRI